MSDQRTKARLAVSELQSVQPDPVVFCGYMVRQKIHWSPQPGKLGGGRNSVFTHGGSGTTLYAAKELHRKAIGCDVSAEACALAEKRLAQELLMIGEG